MKKTSRRSFGKQMTGTLAALSMAGLARSPGSSAQTKPQAKPQAKPQDVRKRVILTSHDTPPPVLIIDGSFIVETEEPDFDETEAVQSQRKKYKRVAKLPGTSKVYLAHIKILDGSGEVIYRANTHEHMSDLRVEVTTEDGIVSLGSVANKFQIDTPSNKKLTRDQVEQPPANATRKGRFRYQDDTSGAQHNIKTVKVKKGGSMVLFDTVFDDPQGIREVRVMIWLGEN